MCDLKRGVDVGVDEGVEFGEGVGGGEIGTLLLVDVVSVVLLTDRIDSGENVDDAHAVVVVVVVVCYLLWDQNLVLFNFNVLFLNIVGCQQ